MTGAIPALSYRLRPLLAAICLGATSLVISAPALARGPDAIADACRQLNITKKLDDHKKANTPKGAYITACLLISSRLRSRLENAGVASALAKYALYPMHDGLLP